MNSGIYIIKNIINNKIYIGSSMNIKKRWAEHKSDLIKNKHHSRTLQKSYNKHGLENFIFEVLEFVKHKNHKELFSLEQKYLDKYKPYERHVGYNISKSSMGPVGVKREDLKNFNIQNKSKKVYQYDLNGNFIKEWSSVAEVSLFYKVNKSNISKNCLGKTKKSFGYVWSYDCKNFISVSESKKKKKVLQYSLEDTFLKEWCSLAEASKHLNIPISKISLVCSNKRKTTGGFKWKYKLENNEKK